MQLYMETLNTIGSIASIVSLLISFFVITQITTIKNSLQNNENTRTKQKNIDTMGDVTGRDKLR